jgi:hypothetical protein
MDVTNSLTIQDGALSLKKADPNLKALELLFGTVLKTDEMLITAAEQGPDVGDEKQISGKTNAWGGKEATVLLNHKTDTGKIVGLVLAKPISDFDDLSLPGMGISFSDLKTLLRVTVPNKGESTIGLMSREISGTLHLGQKIAIPLKIKNPGAGRSFTIESEFESGKGPGLTDLVTLFGNQDDPEQDLQWLPEDLRDSKILSIRDLQLKIDPRENIKLTYVAATLEVLGGKMWPIIPGFPVLTIGGLWVAMEVDYPLEPDYRFPVLKIGGTIGIGAGTERDGKINVTARWPDLAISGGLAPGSQIHIGEILQKFNLSTAGLPEDALTISQLWFSAEPTGIPKRFSFLITIENVWSFQLPGKKALEITALSLDLDYSAGPDQKTSLGGRFSGKFNIAGIDLALSAEHPASGAGWRFEGSTGPGQAIPIGKLIADLGERVGGFTEPAALAGLIIENLRLAIDTQSKNFTFTCEAKFPVDGQEIDIVVFLDLKKQEQSYSAFFSGKITVAQLEFDVIFNQDQSATLFLASYENLAGGKIPLGTLIGKISNNEELLKIANSLSIELKDALFVFEKKKATAAIPGEDKQATAVSKFLFAADVGAGINLSNLPLVGQVFPKEQTLRASFRPIIASAVFEPGEINTIKGLLPSGATPLPDKQIPGKQLLLSANLQLGETSFPLELPVSANQVSPASAGKPGTTAPAVGNPPPVPADGVRWIDMQKSFGPVQFKRVGLQYEEKVLWFFLDASLAAAGLTLSLDGLAAGASLQDLVPHFQLRGLGLDYKSGPVEIGGAFLRRTIDGADEYSGLAIIKAEMLSLAAIGSYTYREGHPSLFVYAILDMPLGGPAFFYITGLAAGFGYNRRLLMPSIEELGQFPLVAEAVGGVSGTKDLATELNLLSKYLPPVVGEYFLAIGVKFTTFKMIESFALLAVQFGNRFELDILGLSTLVVPTPEAAQAVEPLAEVQLALLVTFAPDDGFFGIRAQLTPNSFLFSRACHLTGGFAFYTWFAPPYEGDFVITLGGYHPAFNIPAHYPRVPRLGFNWQITSELSIKGGAYYALTPSALMAGGELQAVWQSGGLRVWFTIGADFLISWKPYHYDARVWAEFGVMLTFEFFGTQHITLCLGADLHIWGPDFSGEAIIHLWIISFTIHFGSDAAPKPLPIDWPTFRASFLPKDNEICSVAVKQGLVSQGGKDQKDGSNDEKDRSDNTKDLGVINPKHFALVTNSVIPVKKAYRRDVNEVNKIVLASNAPLQFGIGAMGIAADAELQTSQTIIINREGLPAEQEFAFNPITKNTPAGLWGYDLSPDLNRDERTIQAVTGFEIVPAKPIKPPSLHDIDVRDLQYHTTLQEEFYGWGLVPNFVQLGPSRDQIKHTIVTEGVAAVRKRIIESLGFIAARDVELSPESAAMFLRDPQVFMS